MYRGFYLATNGVINQQKIMDTISNNIANAQTAGFKADTNLPTTFNREFLLIRGERKPNTTGTIEYRKTDRISKALEQGTFEFSGRVLDVAIDGNVFFNVAPTSQHYAADEQLLTKNGQFNIDDEGFLALGGAGRVLSETGPIQLGSSDFSISETGLLTTAEGQTFQLQLSYIPDDALMEKRGDNMFASEGAVPIPEGTKYAVMQGAFERSNVDVTKEMTRAIEAQRLFDACSTALKQMDVLNQKAATDIARL